MRWYVRPRYVLWRLARWQIAAMPGASPWEPLAEMYRIGCAPLGYCSGESGPEFVIYAPSPEVSGG